MSKLSDLIGTIVSQFQIGISGSGIRRLRFKNSFSGDLEWNPTANRVITLPDDSGTIALTKDMPIGSPEGLTLAYVSATQISVSAGRAVVGSGGSRTIAVLGSSLTKILTSAWTAGTNQGGRFAGTVSTGQTWHVFLIYNLTTGAVDGGFDSSASGANIPSGWVGRIIGSVMTDGSSNIRNFTQVGDTFRWISAVVDYQSSSAVTTTTNLLTLTVPTGIVVTAFGRAYAAGTSFSSLFAATPGTSAGAIVYLVGGANLLGAFNLATNTSAQIICYAQYAGSFAQVETLGFVCPRGAY